MNESEVQEAELPLEGAGAKLARARAAAGLSLGDIAQITKISERQLTAIEAGNYAELPSRAYAVGFTRSYAKALGLDSNEIVQLVRTELAQQEPDNARRTVPAFEPGDPARLPGRKVVWYAAGGVVLVLLAGMLAWPSLYAPGGSLPSIMPSPSPSVQAPYAPTSAAPTGPVVFTATRDQVWVRFADGSGQQLFQKILAQGESWTVPADATAVLLTTARPDGLAITIGGRAVPPLAEREQTMRDVPVTAAALLARTSQPVAPPAATIAPAQTANARVEPRRQPSRRPSGNAEPAIAAPVSAPPGSAGSADPAAASTATADSVG